MNSYSMRLACGGAVIGVLTLSAAALGGRKEPVKKNPDPAPVVRRAEDSAAAQTLSFRPSEEEAAEVFAPGFLLALHTDPAAGWSDLTVSGPEGSVPDPVDPDGDGDAALGPLIPGRYTLRRAGKVLGEFVLNENASVAIATGRLWTDGEVLYLEDFLPTEAELRLILEDRGYYGFSLVGEDGMARGGSVFIPDDARYDEGEVFLRTLRFPGLPAGKYTVCSRGRPVAEIETREGEVTSVELRLGKE